MPEVSPQPVDLILIAKSEAVNYAIYKYVPLDRVELYRDLVQTRMTYFDGGFRPFLELLNKARFGAYFVDSSPAQRREMFSIWNLPSLNGYLAASPLKKAGLSVALIGNFDSETDKFAALVQGRSRPLVGLSTTFILSWSEIARVAKQVRRLAPGARLILGGAFVHEQFNLLGPSALEAPMRKLGVSYALFGYNSENDLLSLVQSLQSGRAKGFPNCAWLDEAGAFHASPFTWVSPSLSGDAVPWKEWGPPPGCFTLQVRASSGCSFRCAFCTYPVTARGYHMMDVKGVETQLDDLASTGVRSLIFIDDTFNVPVERFRKIVGLLARHRFRWYSFFRPQYSDDTLVQAMKDSGCDGVYMGLESANDSVLTAMDKKVKVADYRRGLGFLKKAGIPTFAAFILGYPGETQASLEDDRAFIENEGLDFYSLKEFYYLHSAAIHGRRDEFGLSGEGNLWKHSTMDSLGASAAKTDLFRRIARCVYVDADMGLWQLAYLRDRGLEWQAIRGALALFNDMARRDLEGGYEDKQGLFEKMKTCLKGQP